MSEIEAIFEYQLNLYELKGIFERELKFHPERKWRFDFASKELMIAVELQGGIFGGKSGHNTGVGILRGMEKMNEAQRLGWKVFQFSSDAVKSGAAIIYFSPVVLTAINAKVFNR